MGQSGLNWVKNGSNRVKRGSEVGHVGHPGHVVKVKWVTWAVWATEQVNISIMTIGATGNLEQVF